MGDFFQKIVDRDVSADEAPLLAEELRCWLVERGIIEAVPSKDVADEPTYSPGAAYQSTLAVPNPHGTSGVNGLRIKVGRTVFWSIDTALTCGACGARFRPGDEWYDAADAWFAGDDLVTYSCPECGRPERLTEWIGEWPWGFGNLGLEFWNWTPLSDQFVREVSEKLGHRIVLIRGKL
ncbi:MAG TPA: hypothetical protein VF794_25835 [Archangium sp.]|jgi:hypothetical protein|uniref:hypothetical protein n=1 Tax=Archangium sp. TaxID=1872627 RepID=UPI002ED91428